MADIQRDSDEIELASPPRFAYGERVVARSVVRNDGTFNGGVAMENQKDAVAIGKAMKATKGKANPAQVTELLKKKLG